MNAVVGRALDTPQKLLAKYWHIGKLAAALSARGHVVRVIQAFCEASEIDRQTHSIITIAATRRSRHGNREMLEITDFDALERRLDEFDPDVVHVFGLTIERPLAMIGRWAAHRSAIFAATYHGGRPCRNLLGRRRQRRALQRLALAMFPAQAQADAWRASGVLDRRTRVAVLPEVACPFSGIEKTQARERLGIDGRPLIAWCGRLHPVKDPLTTLRALQIVAGVLDEARLVMAFEEAPLLDEVTEFIGADPVLGSRVVLLGKLRHGDVETLFSAADIFVLSSVREFGSNALVEAMSCGAIPVVSDLPSLRRLTQGIGPARHFAPGDHAAMAMQIIAAAGSDVPAAGMEVRQSSHALLSYSALAADYERHYRHSGEVA